VTLANYFTWNIKVEMLLVCFDLCSVVDRSEVDLGPNDPAIQLTWKFKDSKACVNILLQLWRKTMNLSKTTHHLQYNVIIKPF
jgi:hypothetical protein